MISLYSTSNIFKNVLALKEHGRMMRIFRVCENSDYVKVMKYCVMSKRYFELVQSNRWTAAKVNLSSFNSNDGFQRLRMQLVESFSRKTASCLNLELHSDNRHASEKELLKRDAAC